MKNNSIFSKNNKGDLKFIGDFEAVYNEDNDPWSQSGCTDINYKKYYDYSRNKINEVIKSLHKQHISILEVGCGLGYVVDLIAKNNPNIEVNGSDISKKAIQIAKKKFPQYNFFVNDITSNKKNLDKKFDIVIFNQILWYILEKLDNSFLNSHRILKNNGYLIISQAFFRSEQKYGKDIVNGFKGLDDVMKSKYSYLFELKSKTFNNSEIYLHNDGNFVFKRKDNFKSN
tara:strand:- start:876 stop:1562 length:687 start_codon:yes stop_codon:yes gene_type:complete